MSGDCRRRRGNPATPVGHENIALYGKEPGEVTFTLSSYGQMRNNKDCLNYKSAYRISHGTDLCKLDAAHVRQLLKESLDLRLNKYERH